MSAANKGNKTDLSKAKPEGKEHGQKGDSTGVRAKLSDSTASAEIKSPIASSDKRAETVAHLETSKSPGKLDTSLASQKDKSKAGSEGSFPLKKEGKEKVASTKPRPPPLFIPRAVVQGKGTPITTRKFSHCFTSNIFYSLCNDCKSIEFTTIKPASWVSQKH